MSDAPESPATYSNEFGLTGGIGSGKSSVARRLVAHGARLVDADAIVRELQEPGTEVYCQIVERFGEGVIGPGGELDRAALASHVFGDAAELSALNAIVHPAVRTEMERRRTTYAASAETVILDVPLLDPAHYPSLGGVIVVDIDPELAVQRLVEHRGFSEHDARSRMAHQIGRDERLAMADFVIDNSGTLDQLDVRVNECWDWIQQRRAKR